MASRSTASVRFLQRDAEFRVPRWTRNGAAFPSGITVLDLSDCWLEDRPLETVFRALLETRTLVPTLKFYKNYICNAAFSIAEYLEAMPAAVHEIHLSNNNIRDSGALAILRAIGGHKSYPRVGSNGGGACPSSCDLNTIMS